MCVPDAAPVWLVQTSRAEPSCVIPNAARASASVTPIASIQRQTRPGAGGGVGVGVGVVTVLSKRGISDGKRRSIGDWSVNRDRRSTATAAAVALITTPDSSIAFLIVVTMPSFRRSGGGPI